MVLSKDTVSEEFAVSLLRHLHVYCALHICYACIWVDHFFKELQRHRFSRREESFVIVIAIKLWQ